MAGTRLLRHVSPGAAMACRFEPVDREMMAAVDGIIAQVREGGADAVRTFAEQFGERAAGDPLVLGADEMRAGLTEVDRADRDALERAHDRVLSFALAQRSAITGLDVPVPGGRAGHTIEPIAAVGCYAPGGRYPLPSTVLMTVATARAAGCERVVVASPGSHPVMLAAAAIAGADAFLAVGGAHAVAAMTYGLAGFERVDKIVGPGNRWVTAAKQAVSGVVGIDMLAGPSELVVLADESADARLVACDLLAQAEHDPHARPILVTTSETLAGGVELELKKQLATLRTAEVARAALASGFVCVTECLDDAVRVVDHLAPEHLEIMTSDPAADARKVRHAGAVFIGSAAAEVVGDYGIGPNHTLPTGGTARFRAGLSVIDFIRLRTWIRIDDPAEARGVFGDTARLARVEGLHAHERSAEARSVVRVRQDEWGSPRA